MKKLLFIMMLGLLWSSCSNEEVVVPPTDYAATTTLRTKEEAIAIAENLNAARQENGSRATAKTLKSVDIIGSTNSRTASDTLIYALNYDDNAGFVLVSAAKTGIAVIGYTDEGNFDSEQAAENPNFSYYLDAAKSYVSTQALTPTGPIIDPSTPITLNTSIPTTVKVKWGERNPECFFCPNGHAGCHQTAMAQIMSFLKYPTSINLTYEKRDIDVQQLDWDDIIKHTTSLDDVNTFTLLRHFDTCQSSQDSHLALARLCRELGQRNYAIYASSQTITTLQLAHDSFKRLCPGKTIVPVSKFSSDYGNLFDLLHEKTGAAIISGTTDNDRTHAWVCDGGSRSQTTSKLLKYDGTYETLVTNVYYYHFNWGKCGVYNGSYAAGVFDMDGPDGSDMYSDNNYKNNVEFFVIYK